MDGGMMRWWWSDNKVNKGGVSGEGGVNDW